MGRHYKILLVGKSGVGKTAFVDRLLGKEFEKEHRPTEGVLRREVTVNSNEGEFTFEMIELSDYRKNAEDITPREVNAAIVMYGMDDLSSMTDRERWRTLITVSNDSIPIILVGNKGDLSGHIGFQFSMARFNENFTISSKTGYDAFLPLRWIAERLSGYRITHFDVKKGASPIPRPPPPPPPPPQPQKPKHEYNVIMKRCRDSSTDFIDSWKLLVEKLKDNNSSVEGAEVMPFYSDMFAVVSNLKYIKNMHLEIMNL